MDYVVISATQLEPIESNLEYPCKGCGRNEATHDHHIVPMILGGLDQPSNMIALCDTCHGKIHDLNFTSHVTLVKAGIAKAKASGKLLGPPRVPQEILDTIRSLRAKGLTMKAISDLTNVSVGKIHSYLTRGG